MKTGISLLCCGTDLNLRKIKIKSQEAVMTGLKSFSSTDALVKIIEVSYPPSSWRCSYTYNVVWSTVEIKAGS